MNIQLKAKLQKHIQNFLDKNQEEIGGTEGIYQDDSSGELTSQLMTNACEVVIDAMRHQIELKDRME